MLRNRDLASRSAKHFPLNLVSAFYRIDSLKKRKMAVVVAHLVERSLPTPERGPRFQSRHRQISKTYMYYQLC